MKRRTFLTAVAFAAAAGAPSSPRADGDRAVDRDVRRWLGARTVDVISHAQRAEIMRVSPTRLAPRDTASAAHVGGYKIVGKVHRLDAELLDEFRRTLLDRSTHEIVDDGTVTMKLCGPIEPGVALRFWPKSGKAPVELLFCFKCDDMIVVDPDPWPRSITPGALKLLRLSIRGLPEFEELPAVMRRK